MDTNVENYTTGELLAILELSEAESMSDLVKQIIAKTDDYIALYTEQGNEAMADFFHDVQNELTDKMYDAIEEERKQQTNQWIENQYLTQPNKTEADKVTQRTQKVELYDDPNNHILMKQEELGVANQFNVPISQDVLNPNLKNITERFINLDSQYRQAGTEATHYTLDLSDHLNDVTSLRLYSFQIPVTWYLIDPAYGNTCFWITQDNIHILIEIAPGNYDSTTLPIAINASILEWFTNPSVLTTWVPVTYNPINGKISINLLGAVYQGPSPLDPTELITFTVTVTSVLTFFDYTGQLKGTVNPCVNVSQTHYFNQTLGWMMGYRSPYEYVSLSATGNTGQAILDLNGPRYLILVIDDLNRNHLNNGLVSITELSRTLKLPSYYSPDLPYVCVPTQTSFSGSGQDPELEVDVVLGPCSQLNAGDLLLEKLNNHLNPYPQLVPSAPRTLTQSQLYTINQIMKNNEHTTNYRAKAPTTTDVFAIIPIKGGLTLGSLYTDFGGSLQSFKRTYFGPVNIDRLQISLLDDRGNIVNLNGAEWSITLIAEILYQY